MILRLFARLKSPVLRAGGVLLAALLASAPAARAQAAVDPGADSKRVLPYRIIVNDRLGVHVFQEDNLGLTVRVDAKGDINLNLVGSVHVFGMTLPEAQAAIEKAYRDARYLVHPQVTLTVEETAPRRVSVQGYVKNPSVYDLPIETATTLIDMIAKAGGFADSAKGTAVKLTRVLPDGTIKVFEVDADDVMKGRERDKAKIEQANMVLEAGDIIYVPERII
jgi:polysaccharide export outer membrane protein